MDAQGKKTVIREVSFGDSETAVRWVHLLSDHDSSEDRIEGLDIPQTAKEGLLAQDTRPKCVSLDGGVLVYLRAINFNRNADSDDMVSVRLWISEGLIVSTTRKGRSLRSIDRVFEDASVPGRLKNIGDFLCLLTDEITDKVCDEVEMYEDKLDIAEAALSENSDAINRMDVINIRRQSAQIKRFVMPQREALNALQYTYEGFSKLQEFRIREQADRVQRYLEALDVVRERTLLIQDELRHITAEKQGERMYVLSLVTAVFLPLSFLTGVFGMNVSGLPGLEEPKAFSLLMGLMVFLAVSIAFLMKLRKWL